MRALALLAFALGCGAGADAPARSAPEAEAPPMEPLEARTFLLGMRSGRIYDQAEIRFRFIVEVGGEERVRRTHTWCPEQGRVRVEGLRREDGTAIEPLTVAADGTGLTEGSDARAAYEAFVNDGYWLYAPSKLEDPGVVRALEGDELRVSFGDDVGVTPGDTYWFESDDQGRVTGWRFRLQSGREGAFDWTEHRDVGPLHLSMRREQRDGDAVIRFEDVAVGRVCSLGT